MRRRRARGQPALTLPDGGPVRGWRSIAEAPGPVKRSRRVRNVSWRPIGPWIRWSYIQASDLRDQVAERDPHERVPDERSRRGPVSSSCCCGLHGHDPLDASRRAASNVGERGLDRRGIAQGHRQGPRRPRAPSRRPARARGRSVRGIADDDHPIAMPRRHVARSNVLSPASSSRPARMSAAAGPATLRQPRARSVRRGRAPTRLISARGALTNQTMSPLGVRWAPRRRRPNLNCHVSGSTVDARGTRSAGVMPPKLVRPTYRPPEQPGR